MCSRWRPFCCKTTSNRLLKLVITDLHVSTEIFLISCLIAVFNSPVDVGEVKYTLSLRYPQRKKSRGLKSLHHSSGIIGPFFFEDENGDVETVNGARYLDIVKRFVRVLRRRGTDFNTIWFQQDGATPHISGEKILWLEKTFGTKLISYRKANCALLTLLI